MWEITDFVPGHEFTWRASTLGVQCVGIHRIEPVSDRAVKVVLRLEQTGILAPVVGFLTARLTRRYIGYEAQGLKARSEELVARQ